MLRRFLSSKIHRATVTATDLEYEGSLGLDEALMEAAGMAPGEMVLVFNVNTGARFETYIIPRPRGSRDVMLNGAAARLGEVGDRIIVITFCLSEEPITARVITLDAENNIVL